MINLFLNEKIIAQLPGLTLTNFRVVMELSGNHTFYKHSILLKNVVACQIVEHRKEKWLRKAIMLTIYAIIIYLIGRVAITNVELLTEILKYANNVSLLIFIVAMGYFVFYLFYKKKGLVISSANSEIFFAYNGFRLDLIDFTDNLEVAMINFTIGTVIVRKQ